MVNLSNKLIILRKQLVIYQFCVWGYINQQILSRNPSFLELSMIYEKRKITCFLRREKKKKSKNQEAAHFYKLKNA